MRPASPERGSSPASRSRRPRCSNCTPVARICKRSSTTPGGEITVIVAHPPPPRLGRNRIRQAALADQQISGIAVVATRGQPAVLLTDFNRVGWQAAYRQLRQSGLIDAFGTAGRGTGFTLPTRLSHLAYRGHPLGELPLPPLLRVDYVWHTAHFRALASWIGGNAGSDHLPVLAELVRSMGGGVMGVRVMG